MAGIIGKNDKFRTTKSGTLRRISQTGSDGSLGLARRAALGMWKTPDANMERGRRSKKNVKDRIARGMPYTINEQVAHPDLYPTPTASDYKKRGPNSKQQGLPNAALKANELYPTPAARDYKGANKNDNFKDQLPNHLGGALNPDWVEWLMGFPIGHTDITQDNPKELPRHEDYWPEEPNIPRIGKNIPNRVGRLKAIGNAVVPQVAQHIGEIIMEADKMLYT